MFEETRGFNEKIVATGRQPRDYDTKALSMIYRNAAFKSTANFVLNRKNNLIK